MSKTSDDPWPWLLFGGVIVLWISAIIVLSFPDIVLSFPDIVLSLYFSNIEKRGQFGDSFGVVNALFSGLALAGVIYAIILQREELQLQREELEKTREEIKGQKEQLEAQNLTLQKQNFESSFFQLLGLHNDIANSMAVPKDHSTTYQGRECFRFLLDRFKMKYRGSKWIDAEYEVFFESYQRYVDYYFRTLYNFVKFVDQSDFPKDYGAKKFYTALIRAQLSSDELGLLFFNCLSYREAKFKVLVEKYALLEDMDFKVLISENYKNLYDKSAYGESE